MLDHRVVLAANSRFVHLLGTTENGLNSLYHQAVKEVARGLHVVERAADEVIEVVERSGDHFKVGVQGHSEQLWQETDPPWRTLFSSFVIAARDMTVAAW